MPEELDKLHALIQQAATERGLLVFDGEPDVAKLASVTWAGDWLSFLDLARQTQARLLYLREQRYDPNQVIIEESADPDLIADETSNETAPSIVNLEHDRKAWLVARIRERIALWDTRRDEVISISCIWINNHVAHYWRLYADWIFDCREAIGTILDEAKQIDQENRMIRSQEAARKLHEYAIQLAHHPRFPEATSEEKREFMASQLFPDNTTSDLLGYKAAMSIAKRATLIYWWDVEPEEKVSKTERAKALHAQGESIRNIAAALKMSEAKVRIALSEVP